MAFPVDIDGTWTNGGASLDAGELRRADAAIFAGNGSALGTTGGVSRHGDTSLSVSVDGSDVATIQPGAVVIPGNAVSGTGCYRFAVANSISGALTARNGTNPRIDLVIIRYLDTDVVGTHGAYTGRVEVIAGTPGSVPGVPTLPSMAVELARVTVPVLGGGAATVDLSHRTYATALGGDMAVPTSSMLPASAAKGQRAVALDTLVRYTWDATAWRAIDPRILRGTATVSVGATTGEQSTSVTFTPAFASAPRVTVQQRQGSSLFYAARPGSIATSGFTLFAEKAGTSGSTTIAVDWIAVGD